MSYSQISKSLNIPKSTLSSWFSNLNWSEKVRESLIKKNKSFWIKSLKFARIARVNSCIKRHNGFIKEAGTLFNALKNDPIFLVGITAYWGEGNKSNGNIVSFVNTDPELVKIVSKFYLHCLGIPKEKLRVGLFIYKDIENDSVIRFWSSKLSIPPNQFIKTQVLKSKSSLTHRRSKYGICSLYFSSTEFSIKIAEWIRLLGEDLRE